MFLTLQTGEDNPILRKKSEMVEKIDSKTRKFIKEMVKEMHSENGVGLAAPQVGHNIRIITVRLNPGKKKEMVIPMINPEILDFSKETDEDEEGCLSLPGIWGIVKRSKEITIRFETQKGGTQTLRLAGLNARIVQHEADHLDGILFIDRAKETGETQKEEKAYQI